jgi:hypothetical protein
LFCALVGVPIGVSLRAFHFSRAQVFRRARRAAARFAAARSEQSHSSFFAARAEFSRTESRTFFGLANPPWRLRGWPALLLFHTYTMYPVFLRA